MLDFNNTQIAFAYKSNFQLRRDYSIFRLINQNWLVNWGTKTASKLMNLGIEFPVILGMQPTIFSTFCGGESLIEATEKINHLYQFKVKSILDYGVEGKEDEEDFGRTATAIKNAILFAKNSAAVDIVCSKFTGLIPFHILEKLHSQIELTQQEKKIYELAQERIFEIAQLAYDSNISLFVDAEESWIQHPLDELTFKLMQMYNKEKPIIYNTIQLYRKDRLTFFEEQVAKAQKLGFIYAAKLVRGAYMEKEQKRALQNNSINPIQSSKNATDNDYNKALEFALKDINSVAICVATHNEESTAFATKVMDNNGIVKNHPHVYFSQLYGMSDNISFNLAKENYNVSKYMPYGPVRDVIPYLIRRAQENTSVSGQMSRELKLLKTEIKRRKLVVL